MKVDHLEKRIKLIMEENKILKSLLLENKDNKLQTKPLTETLNFTSINYFFKAR